MCLGNLLPRASRTSASALPTRSLAAANPARSGTVSRSQTMTLGFIAKQTMTQAGAIVKVATPHPLASAAGALSLRWSRPASGCLAHDLTCRTAFHELAWVGVKNVLRHDCFRMLCVEARWRGLTGT